MSRDIGFPTIGRGATRLRRAVVAFLLASMAGVALTASVCLAADPSLPLTPGERAWLAAHPVLRIAPAPDYPPIEFFDEAGVYRGITADILALVERRLGVRFEVLRLRSWEEVIAATRRREVDVWGEATPNPERAAYMRFTSPYLRYPAIILVRRGTHRQLTLDRLAGLKVVAVAGYVTRDYLAKTYPSLPLITVPDLETGLKMVSFGVADAIVENAAPASYFIAKNGLTNLALAGESDRNWELCVASRSDWPELHTLLQKALDTIGPAEREAIARKWVRLDEGGHMTRRSFWLGLLGAAGGATAAVALVLLWNASLRRKVRHRTEELHRELAERRRAEAAANDSEARLKRFFEAACEGLFFHEDGRIVDVNLASTEIFGYGPEELIGRQILEFVALEGRPDVRTRMGAGDPGPYEVRVICKDGSTLPAEVRARTIERAGRRTRVVALQDIRARKLTEEALVRSQAELEARNASLEAIRSIADSLYRSLDLPTVMEEAVRSMMHHTRSPSVALFLLAEGADHVELKAARGFSDEILRAAARLPLAGSLTGISIAERGLAASEDLSSDGRLHPATRQALAVQGFRSAISLPLLEGDRVLGAMNLLYHERRTVSAKEREELTLIGNTVALALANATHVAELEAEMAVRTRAENELRRARDELEDKVAERTRALADANERLQELDRLKSLFIASMSHELRTPLNSIIGFTGVILQGMSGELTARQRDQLQRVYGASKHLLALITDVIDISKIEAGRIDVYPEAFDLGEVVTEAVESVRGQLEDKGLLLEESVPAGLRLHTDRKRVLQCVLNFVGNAVKYTEQGSIRIEAQAIGADVEFSVSDTGIGVAPDALPKLFQPFERIDSRLRVKTPGTGLGLYLTRKLATELLGGTVAAESEQGRGSTFRLRIPRDIGRAPGGPNTLGGSLS